MTPIASELAALTRDLCAIPSETGEEQVIADLVQRRCEALAGAGGAVHRIGDSVVCMPAPPVGDGRPTVALVGHLDTVRCAQDQPTEVREDEGRVYGCGASDMKAGVAVMLALLERWREISAVQPVWIFYDKEEGPNEENGLEPVLASGVLPELDLAYVLEPTDEAMHAGCMGTMHVVVEVPGRRAHSARPWQGENALYQMIPLLERLHARERVPVRVGELTFYEVMVATQVWTDNSKNVVPDRAWVNVNHRFAPGKSMEQAEEELRELIGGSGSYEIRDRAPSGKVYLDHPLVEGLRAASGLEMRPKQAWTDVARFTERGIPAINCGPGETHQAHQSGEWCSIRSLERIFGAYWDFFTR